MANKNNYFYIRNYSSNGEMAIARRAIEEIVLLTINKIKGISLFKTKKDDSPVVCNITKDNNVKIKVNVSIKKNTSVKDVCLKAQDEIKNSFLLALELIPSEIVINVANIEA